MFHCIFLLEFLLRILVCPREAHANGRTEVRGNSRNKNTTKYSMGSFKPDCGPRACKAGTVMRITDFPVPSMFLAAIV